MKYHNTTSTFFLFLACMFSLTSCQKEIQKADLIITNANLWTGNDQQKMAQAMAISGDTILAIGTHEEIDKYKGPTTEVIDEQGSFITPGFIDTHVHLLMGGNSLLNVQLRDANTREEFTNRIANFAKGLQAGAWILEGNWDHTLWGGELPTKEWIDAYTKENPVAIFRLDGHMLLANTRALEMAGIAKNTPDIVGGEIVRDGKGIPTGILKDNAMNLVLNKIPALTEAQKEKALEAANHYLLSNGVTSITDVDSLAGFGAADKLQDAGTLSVRIYSAYPLSKWDQLTGINSKQDKFLKKGILKGFVDGSLGSHTAAFKEPYTDKSDDIGFFINSEEDLYKWISGADKEGLQITVHAIGDRAIHSLLDIYGRVIKENGLRDRRLRIEHAQHIDPTDIKRFADFGVIASMQPYHAIDDGRWAEALIGPERIKTTYAFKSLLDANVRVVFGSDWPVAPATPIEGIYAAVTRRTLDGKNPEGWVPEQKITIQQALKAYTKDAAYASFDEHLKGTLAVGKLADFVVLSADLTKIDPIQIKDVEVLQTFVGGKKVFNRHPE